jgi:hypothetical protein
MNKRTVGDSNRVNLKKTLEAFEYIAKSDFKLLYIGYKIRNGDKEYHVQYKCGHEYWLNYSKIKKNKTGLCFKCSRMKVSSDFFNDW